GAAGQHAPAQRRLPPGLEAGRIVVLRAALPDGASGARARRLAGHFFPDRTPGGTHALVRAAARPGCQHAKKLVEQASAINRRDYRLDDAGRAIVAARIAPGFELMRLG